ELADLFLGHAIGEGARGMALELVGPVQRHQGRHGDQAPVALGQAGTLPDIGIDESFRELDEPRDHGPGFIATGKGGGGRLLRSGHGSSLNPGWQRVESSHGKGDLTMPIAPYRIHAVRYAHRKCTTSEAFYGDHHNGPMTMDYFVWALTNGNETVVVDLGFTEAVGTASGRQFLRPLDPGLADVGVDCRQVQHVVLSHFHYDHVGNYALF